MASRRLICLALAFMAAAARGDDGLDARLTEIAACQLDTAKAVTVRGLALNTGMATLKVDQATPSPRATSPAGSRAWSWASSSTWSSRAPSSR